MRTAAFIRFLLAALLVCLSGCEAHGPTTSAFDGVYQGTGYSTDPGLFCASGVGLNPMKVAGGHVEFGNIRGWVQPDGNIRMVFGAIWIQGQFQGTQFQGVVYNPRSACNFQLVMNRTG